MSDLKLPPLPVFNYDVHPDPEGDYCLVEAVEARERILLARIAELESALRGLLEQEPEHCPCGDDGCDLGARPWRQARAAAQKENNRE